jgi:glutathione S-transferase
MLTLYSYPGLFGVADNNPYGLKTYAFMRLCGLDFRHEHIMDASQAPRRQLPYMRDGDAVIGDSDAIVARLTARFGLTIDAALSAAQRDTDVMIRRTLDDLYWVMSYSRWKDERYWPLFSAALMREHPAVTQALVDGAREYNFRRYDYQGIGRYEPEAAFARGIADLRVLSHLLPAQGFLFGETPCSTDAGLYGFVANILFYEIETPLKAFVTGCANLVSHCRAMHMLVNG